MRGFLAQSPLFPPPLPPALTGEKGFWQVSASLGVGRERKKKESFPFSPSKPFSKRLLLWLETSFVYSRTRRGQKRSGVQRTQRWCHELSRKSWESNSGVFLGEQDRDSRDSRRTGCEIGDALVSPAGKEMGVEMAQERSLERGEVRGRKREGGCLLQPHPNRVSLEVKIELIV